LHKLKDQQDLEEGVAAMKEAAPHFHQYHQSPDQADTGLVFLQ
jgi:hypothetical protein